MSESDNLKWLKRFIDRGTQLVEPSVKPIEPEIRSGGTFLFNQIEHSVPPDRQDVAQLLRNNSALIADCIIEWGYDVDRSRSKEFHRWLEDNEPRIVEQLSSALGGKVLYLGTYAVFSTTEKNTGTYRTIWAFNSFEGMQQFNALVTDGTSVLSRIMSELYDDFRDNSRGAGQSQQIYQPARSSYRL
jgi:hypothetical protein